MRWLTALQAQEFPLAKWSVAQRTRGATRADVEQAFADGVILRTHVLRPTWHFVLGDDIRWLLKVTAPRVHALNAYYHRQHELDNKVFAKCNSLIAKALRDGAHLTRRELAVVLAGAGIRASGPRLAYIVMRAELDAIVCSGAMRGKQHTYALLDDRAPHAKALDYDAALAELTRRYFTSRGPATLNDFLRWSSLTATEGRDGLASVAGELESEVVDGRTYWFEGSRGVRTARTPAVDLVQGYDEIIMSYSESRDDSFRLGDAPFFHAVLLDGRLVGHWRPTAKRNSIRIEMVLKRALNGVEAKALDAAVRAYGKFVGGPVTLAPVRLTAARTRGN
ncbi:MAG TPA: winged helix DNA-binding domain-containing protein [Gemmatimonadales bacterium]|nr:winged helix DNA-binding domain-containing protein [Gemmatimonadales bacterium]